MTETLRPAEVFPPGEYLRDELDARGWSVTDFAQVIGRPLQVVSEILNNRKEITAETAMEIAAALGTTPEVWLNLQNAYRLHHLRDQRRLSDVQRRAKLRALVPLAELQRRHWIPATTKLDVIERAVCDLLRIGDLDETPRWLVAARRANALDEEQLTPSQLAWVARAARLAERVKVRPFATSQLEELADSLARWLRDPTNLGGIPKRLSNVGVALVVVEHLQGSKIDGAAFRLDNTTPVIALSLRGNRFDSVVFTLAHEIAHVLLGHADDKRFVLDEDAATDHATSDEEEDANRQAREWLLPGPIKITPPISRNKVIAAADTLGVHPSLIVGRLQWTGQLAWSSLRDLVPKSKDLLPYT